MSGDLTEKSASTGTGSLIPPNADYYIGKWSGVWTDLRGSGIRRDGALLVQKRKDGQYNYVYSWEGKGNIQPGSSRGILSFESEDTVSIMMKDVTVTFKKKDENTLKGRWEKKGPIELGKAAYYEAYFKRAE
jgi:hypothetical protein